jgi:hypothetical protein
MTFSGIIFPAEAAEVAAAVHSFFAEVADRR